jgi:hypothetical protein
VTGSGWREQRYQGQGTTDGEGRFWILGCPPDPLRLSVFEKRSTSAELSLFSRGWFGPFRAGEPERLLRVPDDWRATAEVTGRILDREGRPIAMRVTIQRGEIDQPAHVWSHSGTGAFRFGPLSPGRYLVKARDGQEWFVSPELALGPHEKRHLGDVRLEQPGRLFVTFAEAAGVKPADIRASAAADDMDRRTASVLSVSDCGEGVELVVGAYELWVTGKGVVTDRIPFRIEPGRRTDLHVKPRAGLCVSLEFVMAGESSLPRSIDVVFRAPDGSVACSLTRRRLVDESRLYLHAYVPPAASYLVEIAGDGGQKGTVRLSRRDLRDPHGFLGPPVMVELR